MDVSPADLQTVGDDEILITWNDGHRSLYTYKNLRYLCPCAFCVDEWSGKRTNKLEEVPQGIHFTKADVVGRYAFKLNWSDNHTTGIYSFDYLRRLCSCSQCAPQGAAS